MNGQQALQKEGRSFYWNSRFPSHAHERGAPLCLSLSPALESLCDLIDRALGFHGIIIYEDERGILFLGDQGWVDNEGCPYLHAQKFNLELS